MRSLSPRARWWLRIVGGLAVLGVVVLTVGAGPFLRGVTSVSVPTVLAALVLTALATGAAAWRWRLVASAQGLTLGWRSAVAAYYRSQLLNSVVPGGVVGDIRRAYRHGQRVGGVGPAARAVATERVAGQLVQVTLVAVVLAALGLTSSLQGLAGAMVAVAGAGVIAVGIVALTRRGRRMLRRELGMLAHLFRDPWRSVQIVLSSIVVLGSHATVFVIACWATGIRAFLPSLVVVALIALTAGAIPLNVGGWGPREGAAASAFAVLGLGAADGVAASAAFGVLAIIGVLPGGVIPLVQWLSARAAHGPAGRPLSSEPTPQEAHA